MLSRAIAIAVLALSLGACSAKDETPADPGAPVDITPTTRDVVDAGLVILAMDADVYGPGGSTGLDIPDAAPRPDGALVLDAATDLGGAGAPCDVFAAKPCADGYGCYPKSDGSGICQLAGYLPSGSNCDPTESSPDSRCTPGYVCAVGFCTAICHANQTISPECGDSISTTCVRLGTSSLVGYCASI